MIWAPHDNLHLHANYKCSKARVKYVMILKACDSLNLGLEKNSIKIMNCIQTSAANFNLY